MALMTGKVLQAVPVLGRENLFVVPGGTALTDLTGVMVGRVQQQGCKAMRALAKVLAPIAGDFDVILIDTPPENTLLCDLALSTGRWLLMPTKTDKGGLVGVQLLAERYAIARELNPALALLGVVLFATNRQATAIHRSVRDRVAVAFGVGSSPVLTAIVGILGSHSRGVRQRGDERAADTEGRVSGHSFLRRRDQDEGFHDRPTNGRFRDAPCPRVFGNTPASSGLNIEAEPVTQRGDFRTFS